jgi:hypothetical protein
MDLIRATHHDLQMAGSSPAMTNFIVVIRGLDPRISCQKWPGKPGHNEIGATLIVVVDVFVLEFL